MDISRYNNDSGFDHFTHQSHYDVDNNNTNYNNRQPPNNIVEISTTQYQTNHDCDHNSIDSSQSNIPVGQIYAIDNGDEQGYTFHMNVVNENCVYEPTGYSKKILDARTQPCTSNTCSNIELYDSSSPSPEYLQLTSTKVTNSDESSCSSSVYSDEDDHRRRIEYRRRVESHYLRLLQQEKLSPATASALSDAFAQAEDKAKYCQPNSSDIGVDKSVWKSIDRERNQLNNRHKSRKPISDDKLHDVSNSPSLSSTKNYEVSDETKPYIEMTNRVKESSSTPSGVDIFEKPENKHPSQRDDSCDKSLPNSPIMCNFPRRALSAKNSTTSERSSRLDPHTYQSYAAGILYSTGKSEQFLKLQKHFAVLERISEIEDKTKFESNFDTLPRSKQKNRKQDNCRTEYDFGKDDELCELYSELEDAKENKEFYYNVSNIKLFQWMPDKDIGLMKKEKSLGDLRSSYLNKEKQFEVKPPFTMDVEDEIRREKDFLDLYESYRYLDHVDEDFDKSQSHIDCLPTGSPNLINEEHCKSRSISPFHGSDIEKSLDRFEVNVENVKKLSRSEPNINSLHVRCMSAPTKRKSNLTPLNLHRSDSSKESYFGIHDNSIDDYFVEVRPTDSSDQFIENESSNENSLMSVNEIGLTGNNCVTYTGSRINWNGLEDSLCDHEKSKGYIQSEISNVPLQNINVYKNNNDKSSDEVDTSVTNLSSINPKASISNNKFAVKDLRGLAKNNEFSQSKFGQLKRSISYQENVPIGTDIQTEHSKPVITPIARGSVFTKEKPASPVFVHGRQNSSEISDPGYVFNYKDMGNTTVYQMENKVGTKQMVFPEKLDFIQKLNDEKSCELEQPSMISVLTPVQLSSSIDKKATDLMTISTNSLPNCRRRVSGNSIFHKQLPPSKSSSESCFYAHPPAYSTVMTSRSKPKGSITPSIYDNESSPSKCCEIHPHPSPQKSDINNSVSSNYINSSTETFIVNSDEDLSNSQSSSLIGRRRDNYQANTNLEKSKSVPDLNMLDSEPKRPRSAKSQTNLNRYQNNKQHWRRTLGNEYVNEPVEGRLPRTLSGDFADVRKNWKDNKWNTFGRSQSSESQTSIKNDHQSSSNVRNKWQNGDINKEFSRENIYNDDDRGQTSIPSNYSYDPYMPPSDILKEVSNVAKRKLIRPVPKSRKPSSVSHMTLEYFDQLGGEWKYGSKSYSSVHPRAPNIESSITSCEIPVNGIVNNTMGGIYTNTYTSPVTSSRERLPTYGTYNDSAAKNSDTASKLVKPIPSKRNDKSNTSLTQYLENITDQDKLMHNKTSLPKPILRNYSKPIQGSQGRPSPPVVPAVPLSIILPPPSRKVPPEPTRKVPPAPVRNRLAASMNSGVTRNGVVVPKVSDFQSSDQSRSTHSSLTNPTSSTSMREWTPAPIKQNEHNKGRNPNAQNTHMSNVESHSELNLTHHKPEPTSNSLPVSPSNVPSPPVRIQQTPTIKLTKLRMPRSSLSAAEQLGLKSLPLVKTNENGVFKHQTSDVKRLVPMSEKEKRRREEDKLYRKQRLEQLYEEERKRKAAQEELDLESRRHNDFFSPSMKSPISNDRFNESNGILGVQVPPSGGMATLSVPVEKRRGFQIQGKAKGLYNFNAQNARELSFRKGDIIYLLRQIDKNWFEGDRYGRVGIFPVNYVEVMTTIEAAQAAAVQAEGQGRIKYNFISQSPVELSLRKGEYVTLLRTVDENWFEGRCGNKQGIFPAAYVEIIREPSTPLITPAPSVICTPMTGRGTPEMLSPVGYDAPTPPPQPSPSAFNQPRFPTAQNSYRQPQQQSPGAQRSQSNPLSPSINQELEQRIFNPKSQLSPTQAKKQVTINTAVRHEEKQVSASRAYGVKSKVPDDDLAINRYRAIYTYKPQNEDELELLEGDEIYVMEQCDDGWYVGTSGRSGNFGTFPGNYVQLICAQF